MSLSASWTSSVGCSPVGLALEQTGSPQSAPVWAVTGPAEQAWLLVSQDGQS